MDILTQDIKLWLLDYRRKYIEIIGLDNCVDIHNLLINNELTESTNDVVNVYYGLYYCHNYKCALMIKYYLIAIDLGSGYAARKLAYYYETIYDKINMVKYYLIAIDLGDVKSMTYLGIQYKINGDYDNTIKYLLMAIDANSKHAMVYLAGYYKSIKNYDDAIKYYLMAYNLNYINELAKCYESINDYQNMIKYYFVNIGLGNIYATIYLAKYFLSIEDYDNVIKCFLNNNRQHPSSLISYACNNNCPKILLHFHNNYLQHITDEYKTSFTDAIILFLRKNLIDSSLLLLIANIDLKYFNTPNKLLLLTKKLLDNKNVSMNLCFKLEM